MVVSNLMTKELIKLEQKILIQTSKFLFHLQIEREHQAWLCLKQFQDLAVLQPEQKVKTKLILEKINFLFA